MIKLSAAVLAGGKGSRMHGNNKAFLRYGNQSFIENILEQFEGIEQVMISVNDTQAYEKLEFSLVKDKFSDIGPMGGLYSCLEVCRNDYLFVCAVDMPLLDGQIVHYMSEFISSDYDCYVIKTGKKVHPLCAIYHKRVFGVVSELITSGNYKMMNLLKHLKVKYVPLEYSCFDESVVSNINDKLDYAKIRSAPVICISGVKNSGKTTLITKIIKQLTFEGYRIGTIKHDGHDFEIDNMNTDTLKHRMAGSIATIIYSDSKWALMKQDENVDIKILLNYMNDVDLVIVEGLKHSNYPKIEVVRAVNGLKLVCDKKYLLAVASDYDFEVDEDIRFFDIDDVDSIVGLIKDKVVF